MTIVGTYFDLETRQWLSSGLLAFFERSKKFISYDVFKNPSSFFYSFIGMVIPRGGSKRVEIHPAGGRERERATRSIFKGLGAI